MSLSQSESNIRYESIYYHSYALKITIYQLGFFNESWVKIYQMSLSQSESTILQESIILPFLPYIKDSEMNLEWKWVDWMNMCWTWPHDIYIDVALKRVTLSFQAIWLQKTIRINKIHDIVIILVVLSRYLTGGTCTLINIWRFSLMTSTLMVSSSFQAWFQKTSWNNKIQ